MSSPALHVRRAQRTTRMLAILSLASWPLLFWCYGLRVGGTAAADTALPVLIAIGTVSLMLRVLQHRHPGDFAIFFPVRLDQRGTNLSIRVNAVLLAAFNLGASWFLLHTSFSLTTTVLLLVLATVSAMNLTDECWIARRHRLATSP